MIDKYSDAIFGPGMDDLIPKWNFKDEPKCVFLIYGYYSLL